MPHIRPYESRDRDALYNVCLRTGDDGNDATGMFTVPTILGEVYVGPYLEFEPNSAWVVDDNGTAAGYVLCAPDTAAFETRCESEWWPTLRERYPVGSFSAGSPDEEVVGIIHHPHRADAALLVQYPAHLHIDLAPEMQSLGLGGALIRQLLSSLEARGIPGVFLGVASGNSRAIGFYEHLGFATLGHADGTTTMGKKLTTT